MPMVIIRCLLIAIIILLYYVVQHFIEGLNDADAKPTKVSY